MITTTHYLVLSLILFALGLTGVMVRRNFIAFARQLGDLSGQVIAVFVITIAAAEAAIGLGIIIALVRLKQTVQLDRVNVMQG